MIIEISWNSVIHFLKVISFKMSNKHTGFSLGQYSHNAHHIRSLFLCSVKLLHGLGSIPCQIEIVLIGLLWQHSNNFKVLTRAFWAT